MNPQDPLAELRDIHLPQAIGWWPPAPGWWLLLLFIVAGLGLLARALWLRRARKAYRRRGVQELEQLYAMWQRSEDTPAFLQQLNALLKRVALFSFPDSDVAAMTGARWTSFLDQHAPGGESARFSGGPLEYGPYSNKIDTIDVPALYRCSLLWLRKHRGETND